MSQNCNSNLSHDVSDSIAQKPKLKPNHGLILYIGDLESIQKFKCSFRIGIPFENYLVNADGKRSFNELAFKRCHIAILDGHSVGKLVALMPAVSHLEIVMCEVNYYSLSSIITKNNNISPLINLLARWAPTLKKLKFCCLDFQPKDSQFLLMVIRGIKDYLSVLEHLTLDLDGELLGNCVTFDQDQKEFKMDLPIPGQLKEFFIQTRDRAFFKSLLDTLEFQAGKTLTEIGIGFPYALSNANHIVLVNHPLAARFKLLPTRYEPLYAPTSFPNLKGYTAHWHPNPPLNSVTSKLSTLEHLQYLEVRRLSHNENVSVDPVALSSSLPSVEILRIHINNQFDLGNDHTVFQDDGWASLFPSVQIVNLIHMGDFCAKCYPKDGEEEGKCIDNPPGFEQSSERLSCLSQLLAPLTVLPSLHKIFYQRNYDLKTIAEFTGKGEFVKTHAYIY